jgi:hypothetical protein
MNSEVEIDAIMRVRDITQPLPLNLDRPLEIEVGCGKGRFYYCGIDG